MDPFFQKYGRYLPVSHRPLAKADYFFEHHGYISTFVGLPLPGIRQYISLPAGLARMNVFVFCAANVPGAGIWVLLLAALGYVFGRNEELVIENLHWITLGLVFVCSGVVVIYWRKWNKLRRDGSFHVLCVSSYRG